MMTDEEVIKRRLIIDGDGTGEERRINSLHKEIYKFCSTQESPEEIDESLSRLLLQISQCEYSVKKSRKVSAMNSIEFENYSNLSRKITMDIEEVKKKIEKTKDELAEALRIRKNKMEYDMLGKIIAKQPDRKKSEERLTQLQNELDSLKTARSDVTHRLSARKRQFHGLILMLNQLESSIAEGDIEANAQEAGNDQVMEVDSSIDDVIVVNS